MISTEAQNVYRRFRKRFSGSKVFGRNKIRGTMPFEPDRDPEMIHEAMLFLASSMGWDEHLAQADLLKCWDEIVGEDVAEHARPLRFNGGVLEVQADSSAWATQLRLMRKMLLSSVVERFPGSGVSEIVVRAPGSPSWNHGPRSVSGRGPRDTYG